MPNPAPETSAERDLRVLLLPATQRDGEVTCALLERSGMSCLVCAGAHELATEVSRGAGVVVLSEDAERDPRFSEVVTALTRQPGWSDVPIVLLSATPLTPVFKVMANVTLLRRPASTQTLLSSVQAALRSRERQYQIRDYVQELQDAEEAILARERELRSVTDNTPDVISRFDRDLRHLFVNPAASEITGIAQSDFIGRTLRELGMPGELCARWESALSEVFASGQRASLELPYPSPKGLRVFSTLLVPEPDGNIAAATVLCVARDLTEKIRAEEALRLADRRKDEFLAMLAHELRNPLAPIRNASELLARADVPQIQGTVQIIKRQIMHLTRLVDDLLDVSRITQGRIDLQFRTVELASIVAQAVETVEPLMRERRHKVFVTTSIDPLYTLGDHARLVQCLGNVLTNAAKYTDPGGEIRIELRPEEDQALIVVSDSGVGIPQELLPRIFELFVQGNRALDRSQGGLGIGLSLVQRLIEMHHGTIRASSPGPGRGSVFELRLPRVEVAQAAPQTGTGTGPVARRVLVVDDNADAADTLALVLRLDGHTVETVYTPAAALERARSFGAEIVLLDIGLPGIDGYEVARRIRAFDGAVRLVALTGYAQDEDRRRTAAAGFDAHLSKPVDFAALAQLLQGQLE